MHEPFYEKDLKEGRITREGAQELVECVFVKSQETGFLHPPIWSGTGGGALGFQTMTVGGIDADGEDVSSEMSLIVLDAMKSPVIDEKRAWALLHSAAERLRRC
jgi:formate C-acetyltransferase